MVEQVTRIEELEYKWVDGYKHRAILVDIGWGYSVRDGYTTTDPQVITLTNTLEKILSYQENGISNLTDYLMEFLIGRTGDSDLFTNEEGIKQLNKLSVGINRLVEDIELTNLGDVYIAEGMINDIESGNLEDVIDHVESQMIINGDFMKSMYTKRFYYDGRGYHYLLVGVEPGTERYQLEGFVQDSRGYLYTEDKECKDELDEYTEAYKYLTGETPGLRRDLIKLFKASRYNYLTLPGHEEELEDVLGVMLEWTRGAANGPFVVGMAMEYRNVTNNIEFYERWLDNYFRGTEE